MRQSSNTTKLVKSLRAGDKSSLARLITLVEEDSPEIPDILGLISSYVGQAYRIGITGTPGAGKSTLINSIITSARNEGSSIGIIAVDPSSAITGGAVLGDRIRMQQHYLDEGVFIRSMATRGNFGGLSKSVSAAADLLDAYGKDIIIIETTGVGQTEVAITDIANVVVVVMVPGFGDSIQFMKAGLLEIGDVFVVNKADNPGADDVVEQLQSMLDLGQRSESDWRPPVLKTVAVKNEGLVELADTFWNHRQYLVDSGNMAKHNFKWEFQFFRQLVMELATDRIFGGAQDSPAFAELLDDLKNRKIDPISAAEKMLQMCHI